ncbi:ESCRT-III subunit protein [Hanseniaspora uvarum]|nr:ESCRT-III subunit protein [Hanseniaspora uvarum]
MGQESSKSRQYEMSEHDKAMLQLKRSRDNIDKYSQSMYKKIHKEQRMVKDIIRTKKNLKTGKLSEYDELKCKTILKRIRYQESLVTKAVQQLMSLEEMIISIDFKQVEKMFLKGLENGNGILKELNKELTLEKVDAILDESEEQMALANEVNDVLAESSNTAGQYLDEEVDEELLAMMKEMEKTSELKQNLPNVSNLPEPVSDKKHIEEKDEEVEEQPALLVA